MTTLAEGRSRQGSDGSNSWLARARLNYGDGSF